MALRTCAGPRVSRRDPPRLLVPGQVPVGLQVSCPAQTDLASFLAGFPTPLKPPLSTQPSRLNPLDSPRATLSGLEPAVPFIPTTGLEPAVPFIPTTGLEPAVPFIPTTGLEPAVPFIPTTGLEPALYESLAPLDSRACVADFASVLQAWVYGDRSLSVRPNNCHVRGWCMGMPHAPASGVWGCPMRLQAVYGDAPCACKRCMGMPHAPASGVWGCLMRLQAVYGDGSPIHLQAVYGHLSLSVRPLHLSWRRG